MTKRFFLTLCAGLPLATALCDEPKDSSKGKVSSVTDPPMTQQKQTATLAAGCFWCVEAVFQRIKGVEKVVSGFTGGKLKNPTYEDVCSGTTGHAEAVQITFNPEVISYDKILDLFWAMHDPTTLNRQGHDIGTHYRSAIFYHSAAQKEAAEASKKAHAKDFADPIVTEITEASTFYPAEDYHQNYYNLNASKNPYCRVVIDPKLRKLGLETK